MMTEFEPDLWIDEHSTHVWDNPNSPVRDVVEAILDALLPHAKRVDAEEMRALIAPQVKKAIH